MRVLMGRKRKRYDMIALQSQKIKKNYLKMY